MDNEVKIAAARSYRGNYTPGDNTGTEVSVGGWYRESNNPWHTMYRCKYASLADKMAAVAVAGCNNDHIGYFSDHGGDYERRVTLYKEAQKVNFNLAAINVDCECDCSSFIACCVNAAGIEINPRMGTGNADSILLGSGYFDKYTDQKYLTSPSYLRNGDILLQNGHIVMVVNNGSLSYEDTYQPNPDYDPNVPAPPGPTPDPGPDPEPYQPVIQSRIVYDRPIQWYLQDSGEEIILHQVETDWTDMQKYKFMAGLIAAVRTPVKGVYSPDFDLTLRDLPRGKIPFQPEDEPLDSGLSRNDIFLTSDERYSFWPNERISKYYYVDIGITQRVMEEIKGIDRGTSIPIDLIRQFSQIEPFDELHVQINTGIILLQASKKYGSFYSDDCLIDLEDGWEFISSYYKNTTPQELFKQSISGMSINFPLHIRRKNGPDIINGYVARMKFAIKTVVELDGQEEDATDFNSQMTAFGLLDKQCGMKNSQERKIYKFANIYAGGVFVNQPEYSIPRPPYPSFIIDIQVEDPSEFIRSNFIRTGQNTFTCIGYLLGDNSYYAQRKIPCIAYFFSGPDNIQQVRIRFTNDPAIANVIAKRKSYRQRLTFTDGVDYTLRNDGPSIRNIEIRDGLILVDQAAYRLLQKRNEELGEQLSLSDGVSYEQREITDPAKLKIAEQISLVDHASYEQREISNLSKLKARQEIRIEDEVTIKLN